MRRALLLYTVGHTDVQLVEGERRRELDKDRAGRIHEQLAQRSDWRLVEAKPKHEARREASATAQSSVSGSSGATSDLLPPGPFDLSTPKLDAVLTYLDEQRLELAHALILHTDRPGKNDPTQAGPILLRRLRERGHSSAALVSYLSGEHELLEDRHTRGDELLRRAVVRRLDAAIAEAVASPHGPFDLVVIATLGGMPKVQAVVAELAQLHAGSIKHIELEVPDVRSDPAERAILRSEKTDPSAVVAATRHALALVERGDFIAAWGAVSHLAPKVSPVFRWLYEWATSMPHEPGTEPPADFPLPRADQRALAAALRVELALRRGDLAHAIQKTFAFFEAAIWDLLHRDHIQGPHAPDAPLSFVLHPPPDEDAKIGLERDDAKHPGHHHVKNYGAGSFEIRKKYLERHTPSPASIAPLKAFADAVGQVEHFRNMVAHSEPQRTRLGVAQKKMGQLRLWSKKQTPSITSQPLFGDVLSALGAPPVSTALDGLLRATRALALALWRDP